MTTIMRIIVVLVFVLVAIPSSRNTNKKYVKGASVVDLPSIQREDLCSLRLSLSSSDSAVNEESLRTVVLPPVERLSTAEAISERRTESRAVVQSVERSLVGGGAHRDVHSEIALDVELFDAPGISVEKDCELVVVEHLSEGVFADAFQLSRLQQQEAVKAAHIYGDTDLERPAKNSFQSIVEIRQRLVPAKKEGLEVHYRSEVTLPLHARYPPVTAERYFLVNITFPHLLIFCEGRNSAGTSESVIPGLCIYARWSDTSAKVPLQTLQWAIPSGDPAHAPWVAKLTTASALFGVVAILLASRLSFMQETS